MSHAVARNGRGDAVAACLLLCRFSDAGMRRLSTRCGGRRPKSANARSRGSVAPGSAASAMGIVCWWRSRWWTRREQNASTTFAFWHECCKTVFLIFLMFLARVISNRCTTSDNHCAIDRSICVRWHDVNQFLARRNIHGTFKQTSLRLARRQRVRFASRAMTKREINRILKLWPS